MEVIILIAVIIGIYFLGKYAIEEGQRVEQNNQLMRNIRRMDKKEIQDKRKEIIWERNPDTGKMRSRKSGEYENTVSWDDGVCEGEYDHDAVRGEN